ncbi:response regulator transcription factor [Antarcticibacterium arcticum]|uniref:Response regulator transcription factor n=1 Tax=Antarcticibacterium arcticum TaxID=2585771 RepID=A0A5B8YG16_9FLAO|nr:response regulator transcription factor [Antarcticibacterium arcticum]QED36890.1 response regulator transcription factor [Antarcticibacterium arcticum]
MKILVVEDEQDMLDNIRQALLREHHIVETAPGFLAALEKIGLYEYDLILLDITLPDGNGLDLLNELKENGKNPGVIILSARDSLDDKLSGLNLGADDYLPKPFHFSELFARIHAIFRRNNFNGNNQLTFGNISLDTTSRSVKIKNEEVVLNRKEYDILTYLIINKDRLVRKSGLAEHVWGDHIDQSNDFDFIYSQIKNLRKKLTQHKANVSISSIYGMGYKMIIK